MAIQKDRYGTQKEDVNAKYPFEGKDNVELARLAQEAESSDFWKEYMVHIKDMIELKNRGLLSRDVIGSDNAVLAKEMAQVQGYVLGLQQPLFFLKKMKDEIERRNKQETTRSADVSARRA